MKLIVYQNILKLRLAKNGIILWTKTFKRAIDKFKIIHYELDYDENQFLLPYDEYHKKQNIDVHLKSFRTYNKFLSQYEYLLDSNQELIQSLSNELSRLHNILFSLTKDVSLMYHSQTISYAEFIVSGYVRRHFAFIGFYSFEIPPNIGQIIFKYFRFYEFQTINYYYNDKDDEDVEKYENLLLQSTTINQNRNLAIFNHKPTSNGYTNHYNFNNIIHLKSRSEIIVIDTLLTYKMYDCVNINLEFMESQQLFYERMYLQKKKN